MRGWSAAALTLFSDRNGIRPVQKLEINGKVLRKTVARSLYSVQWTYYRRMLCTVLNVVVCCRKKKNWRIAIISRLSASAISSSSRLIGVNSLVEHTSLPLVAVVCKRQSGRSILLQTCSVVRHVKMLWLLEKFNKFNNYLVMARNWQY